MLHGYMTLVGGRFLVFLRLFCALFSHTVLPNLGVIRTLIDADAMGFNLASIQRCTAITCVAQGEVVGRR